MWASADWVRMHLSSWYLLNWTWRKHPIESNLEIDQTSNWSLKWPTNAVRVPINCCFFTKNSTRLLSTGRFPCRLSFSLKTFCPKIHNWWSLIVLVTATQPFHWLVTAMISNFAYQTGRWTATLDEHYVEHMITKLFQRNFSPISHLLATRVRICRTLR